MGNPCASVKKYRDYAIAASSDALRMLDEVPVLRHQQVAVRGLMDHRRKIGATYGDTTYTEIAAESDKDMFDLPPGVDGDEDAGDM